MSVASIEQRDPSVESLALAARMAAVIDTMRDDATFNLEMWLQAHERGMGARLTLETSSQKGRAGNVEADYESQRRTLKPA